MAEKTPVKIRRSGSRRKQRRIAADAVLLWGVLVLAVSAFIFTLGTALDVPMPFVADTARPEPAPKTSADSHQQMRMTAFDAALAKEKRDKNNDGKCDVCGMPVEECIEAGMLECTMGPGATIGLLGSAHHHAGFAWFKDGQLYVPGPEAYAKSMFIHVETERDPAKTGRILHVHATGVPLKLFFDSVGVSTAPYRLFVNGQAADLDTYAPKDGDRILVTTSGEERLAEELGAVPDASRA